MATNQYYTFAAGVPGAVNTLTTATYLASPLRTTGHVPGIALSEVINTTLRQTSVGVAGLAKFATDYGLLDALDDGDPATMAAAIKSALDQLLSAQQFWHAGDFKFSAVNAIPTGWLKANGAIISRATYAPLFAAIGTTYGAGNGSTTFQLPDGRALVLRAFDDGRGVDNLRVFGSEQMDALQNLIGFMGIDDRNTTTGRGAFRTGATATGNALAAGAPVLDTTASGGDGQTNYAEFNASLSVGARTATETRARNLAALLLIKT